MAYRPSKTAVDLVLRVEGCSVASARDFLNQGAIILRRLGSDNVLGQNRKLEIGDLWPPNGTYLYKFAPYGWGYPERCFIIIKEAVLETSYIAPFSSTASWTTA